jgi:hypothetical protein
VTAGRHRLAHVLQVTLSADIAGKVQEFGCQQGGLWAFGGFQVGAEQLVVAGCVSEMLNEDPPS